jgi:tRNA nucleotidyltransferase/poly(A) polymerase
MSDYMFVLDSHLDAGQNRAVAEIQRIATEAGMTVWLTGGAMRDMLRGAPIRDLDFTVERDAVKSGKALAAALGGKVVSEDSLKRWVELELPGNIRASVSNARTERYSKPGGKPQVAPATIHEDLTRRDFTINAIALSLNRGSRGLLVDPANGQADLAGRELRATNPYIFFDDPTRIFRMIRFQHVLGFEVAPRLQSQLENALLEDLQTGAPASALAGEIRAAAMEPNAVPMIEAFDKLGLLKVISPGLTGPKLNVAGLTRLDKMAHSVLPAGSGGGWLAFLSVLVEKLSAKERADVVRAFEMGAREAAVWKKLDAQVKKLESVLKSPRTNRPSQVWQALEGATTDEVLMVLYHSSVRVVQDRIRAFYEKYLPQAQEVSDEQVAATGVKPGTPKFDKARHAMIATKLNARPRKIVPPEPEPEAAAPPPPMAMVGARVRK